MKIIWTNTAKQSLKDVLDYTKDNFGLRQVDIIIKKIEKHVNLLSVFPYSSRKLDFISEDIRCAVLSKELKIIYKVEEQQLSVLYVWNSKMSIKTLTEKINNT